VVRGPSPARDPPLVRLPCPSETPARDASARMAWAHPPCPRPPWGWAPRPSRLGLSGASCETPERLSWAWVPLQRPPNVEPRLSNPANRALMASVKRRQRGSSHEVVSPTAFPRMRQRLRGSGMPIPTACVSRFSQPPDAFIRPMPAGLVSCQIRSWGSPFRALLLSHSRAPSSGAAPLLTLGTPERFHHRGSAKSQAPRICASAKTTA